MEEDGTESGTEGVAGRAPERVSGGDRPPARPSPATTTTVWVPTSQTSRLEGLEPRRLPSVAAMREMGLRKRPRQDEAPDLRNAVENAANLIGNISKEIRKLRDQYEKKNVEMKSMAETLCFITRTPLASPQSTVR